MPSYLHEVAIDSKALICGYTLVNLATDWKIVMQQWAWFYAVCVSAPNRFGLELYDVIIYNDVISTANSLEFIKDVHFTDVQIVENIIV